MLRYDRQTKPGLVALYEIRPGNGAGPFLQPRSPHGAVEHGRLYLVPYHGDNRKFLSMLLLLTLYIKVSQCVPCQYDSLAQKWWENWYRKLFGSQLTGRQPRQRARNQVSSEHLVPHRGSVWWACRRTHKWHPVGISKIIVIVVIIM